MMELVGVQISCGKNVWIQRVTSWQKNSFVAVKHKDTASASEST